MATPTLSEKASFDGACAISPNDSESYEKGVSDALDGWMRKQGASRGWSKGKGWERTVLICPRVAEAFISRSDHVALQGAVLFVEGDDESGDH